jgi:hypothetical protein
VRIAYAIPRVISLISVCKDNLMNLFPTDLHGSVTDNFYTSSLRIGGKANAQVEGAGRIVLSEMHVDYFREVYALGKNHMKEMKSLDNFMLLQQRSAKLALPLPVGMLRYRELEILNSCSVGLHRIHLYKVLSDSLPAEGARTLAHIDHYYMQWRLNHALTSEALFR